LSLSRAASEHLFGEGEAIVRQGESGASMFVILHGRVRVVLEPSGQQVARIEAGGFFGEMSVLTGEPRSASVRAESDVRLLEISAAQMRDLVQATPGLLEHISQVMASRRVGLAAAEASAATGAATVQSSRSLLARFQRFLGL
jgi:CRP-like cAMP-binding protein